MDEAQWEKIESAFRLWSFRIYYRRSFKEERDLTLRFLKALVASSKPIRDRQAVIDWYERGCKAPDEDDTEDVSTGSD